MLRASRIGRESADSTTLLLDGGRPFLVVNRNPSGLDCLALVLAENGRERVGQCDRRGADLALCGLNLSVPRGAANMNASVIEVDVRPLEAENLACPHPCQGEDNEQRAPWLLGQVEDGLDLRKCKMRGDVAIALWQNQFSQFNFHSGIAPVISCGEHRRERAQNVQHGFPRCAF